MVEHGSDELERALGMAGAALRARPVPDVAPAVRARLESGSVPGRAPQRIRRWRGVLAAGLAAVGLALVPGVRGAVADLVDSLPGITLRTDKGGSVPMPPVSASGEPLGGPLGLVGAIDLAAARSRVPYDLPVPAGLGDPDAVYVREGVVTMLWRASSALPALGGSGVGLVIDVVDGSRGPVFEKLLLDVEVEWFTIDGASAAWVGQAHPLVVVNAEGVPDREHERIAARTLIVSGETTIRVESMLSRDGAIAVVRSLG